MNILMKNSFLPVVILLLSAAGAANASTFVGELELDKASTVSPADHHTLWLKRVRVVVNTDAIEKAPLALSNINTSVDPGTDDVCNPRDTDIAISASTSAAPIDFSFFEVDNEHDVLLSNQQSQVSFSAVQSYSQAFELPVSSAFDPNLTASLSGSTGSLSERLEMGARMATSLNSQDIAIEITSVEVGAVGKINANTISSNVRNVIVHYRAYPLDQNPANPMELVQGTAKLRLVK